MSRPRRVAGEEPVPPSWNRTTREAAWIRGVILILETLLVEQPAARDSSPGGRGPSGPRGPWAGRGPPAARETLVRPRRRPFQAGPSDLQTKQIRIRWKPSCDELLPGRRRVSGARHRIVAFLEHDPLTFRLPPRCRCCCRARESPRLILLNLLLGMGRAAEGRHAQALLRLRHALAPPRGPRADACRRLLTLLAFVSQWQRHGCQGCGHKQGISLGGRPAGRARAARGTLCRSLSSRS